MGKSKGSFSRGGKLPTSYQNAAHYLTGLAPPKLSSQFTSILNSPPPTAANINGVPPSKILRSPAPGSKATVLWADVQATCQRAGIMLLHSCYPNSFLNKVLESTQYTGLPNPTDYIDAALIVIMHSSYSGAGYSPRTSCHQSIDSGLLVAPWVREAVKKHEHLSCFMNKPESVAVNLKASYKDSFSVVAVLASIAKVRLLLGKEPAEKLCTIKVTGVLLAHRVDLSPVLLMMTAPGPIPKMWAANPLNFLPGIRYAEALRKSTAFLKSKEVLCNLNLEGDSCFLWGWWGKVAKVAGASSFESASGTST